MKNRENRGNRQTAGWKTKAEVATMVLTLGLVFFLSGLMVLVLIPFHYDIRYLRQGSDDEISITVKTRLTGRLLRFEVPILKASPARLKARIEVEGGQARRDLAEKPIEMDMVRTLNMAWKIRHLFDEFPWISSYLTTKLEMFNWQTRIGAGDAALTATAVGAFWGIKGAVVGWLAQKSPRLVHPEFQVVPDYDGVGIDTMLHCILRLSLGNIMLMGIHLVRDGLKGVAAVGSRRRLEEAAPD